MTVLLVLAMFAIFLTIDYFYAKAKHPVLQVAPAMSKHAGGHAADDTQPGRRLLGSREPALPSRAHLGVERESRTWFASASTTSLPS